MGTFEDILKSRRQKFLDPKKFLDLDEALQYGININRNALLNKELTPNARNSIAWSIAVKGLELIVLRYTSGTDAHELRDSLPPTIDAFEYKQEVEPRCRPDEVRTYDLTYIEGYVTILWLLSLCTLLGHREQVPRIVGWIDELEAEGYPNRGRDGLFESIVEKLTGRMVESGRFLLHPTIFRSLAKATVAEPEDRPAFVVEYLKGWYKSMKGNYWHGTHKDSPRSFFGYWSFEAALVTYLWDIDDSSYRDHEFYPKDLVDFARGLTPPVDDVPSRMEGGKPCPRAGWWFTPAKADSRRHFRQGEMFPVIEGSTYGDTFWQWSLDQSDSAL